VFLCLFECCVVAGVLCVFVFVCWFVCCVTSGGFLCFVLRDNWGFGFV
jgi:hypothetical protein